MYTAIFVLRVLYGLAVYVYVYVYTHMYMNIFLFYTAVLFCEVLRLMDRVVLVLDPELHSLSRLWVAREFAEATIS